MINPFRVLRRRKDHEDRTEDNGLAPDTPRWVWWFTDVGRPLAAIVVLVLCAPGEQHLAELSGWSDPEWLSWGMAGLFSMYAGIAAVVATVRPKGAPGKRSAVWGAVVSLLLAMGAQPVSHLFVTGWLTASPRAPWPLIVTVSCVPPFILGHLLHLAASPGTSRETPAPVPVPEDTSADKDTVQIGEDKDGVPVLKDIRPGVPMSSGTRWLFEDRTYRAGVPENDLVSSGDKDAITSPSGVPGDEYRGMSVTDPLSPPAEDTGTRPGWLYDEDGIRPGHREDTGDAATWSPPPAEDTEDKMPWMPPPGLPVSEFQNTVRDDLSSRRKLPELIKDIRAHVGDDPDAIKDGVLSTPGFEDMRSTPQKRNTLNTAVRRALRKTA
jgi:hypothetical protein